MNSKYFNFEYTLGYEDLTKITQIRSQLDYIEKNLARNPSVSYKVTIERLPDVENPLPQDEQQLRGLLLEGAEIPEEMWK